MKGGYSRPNKRLTPAWKAWHNERDKDLQAIKERYGITNETIHRLRRTMITQDRPEPPDQMYLTYWCAILVDGELVYECPPIPEEPMWERI